MDNKIKGLLEDESIIDLLKNNNIDDILKGDVNQDLIRKLMENEKFKDAVETVDLDNHEEEKLEEEEEEYEHKFYAEDKIKTINLKNEKYNNKTGCVDDYDYEKKRYIVCIENKMLAIKEENLELINDTIENID